MGLPVMIRDVIITDMAVYVSFWEFIILLPNEYMIWHRLFTQGRCNPPGWFCITLRYLIVDEAVIIILSSYAFTFKTDAGCKTVAVFNGLTTILTTVVRGCAMANRANSVASSTLFSQRGKRFSTLRILQASIAITLLASIAGIAVSVWDLYVNLGGWTSRVDLVTGSCFDPNGITGALTGASSSLFWGGIVTVAFEIVCLAAVFLSLRTLRISWKFSKLATSLRTHSFGFFALALLLALILTIIALTENDAAPVLAKPFFTLLNVVTVRIMLQEQSVLMKRVRNSNIIEPREEAIGGSQDRDAFQQRIAIERGRAPSSLRKLSCTSNRAHEDFNREVERQQGITIEREEIIDLEYLSNEEISPTLQSYPTLSRGRMRSSSNISEGRPRKSDSSLSDFTHLGKVVDDDDASSQASRRWPALARNSASDAIDGKRADG